MTSRLRLGQADQQASERVEAEGPSASVPGDVPFAISIVSNSQLLREGLVTLLSRHIEVELIGRYAGAGAVVEYAPNPPGHVVLIDGGIGRERAIVWTRHWRGMEPPAAVLVLELENSGDVIIGCIEAGANGYTLQGASAAEVAGALVDVQRGVAHCSPEITAQLFARLASLAPAQPVMPAAAASLTTRELEILGYLAMDYSNQEIATLLVIEVCTVKHHVHNILNKLNLRRRWDAGRLALEQGWVGREVASDQR